MRRFFVLLQRDCQLAHWPEHKLYCNMMAGELTVEECFDARDRIERERMEENVEEMEEID